MNWKRVVQGLQGLRKRLAVSMSMVDDFTHQKPDLFPPASRKVRCYSIGQPPEYVELDLDDIVFVVE